MKPPAAGTDALRPRGPGRPRDDTLGERLRANLARRKAQARARAEPVRQPSPAAEPPEDDSPA